MQQLNPQYITDKKGNKISVVLPIKDFEAMLEQLEELEDIRMFDESGESDETAVPIYEAFKIIEDGRKRR